MLNQKGLIPLIILFLGVSILSSGIIGSALYLKNSNAFQTNKTTTTEKSEQDNLTTKENLSEESILVSQFSFCNNQNVYKIEGISMQPQYINEDLWGFEDFKSKKIQRDEVIIFKNPVSKDYFIIKRVIGLSGEKIRIQGGKVYINGVLKNEPNVPTGQTTTGRSFIKEGQEVIVPDNSYAVLGDNRHSSLDSREWGFLNEDQIIGKLTKKFEGECTPKTQPTAIPSQKNESTNPFEITYQGYDSIRLTDLPNLQIAIHNNLQVHTGSNFLCSGLNSCFGSTIDNNPNLKKADGTGWIKADLSDKSRVSVTMVFIDPKNDQDTHYVYCAVGDDWEINSVLQSQKQKPKMEFDGGDNMNRYELGNNLTLIDNTPNCKY